mmetsp:Transcript_2017/g.4594  ORF Transcript_2017/g.4594 Transcript_2017/m.4594 type:complete len:101 (+) Transcript_2017:106-408(+)
MWRTLNTYANVDGCRGCPNVISLSCSEDIDPDFGFFLLLEEEEAAAEFPNNFKDGGSLSNGQGKYPATASKSGSTPRPLNAAPQNVGMMDRERVVRRNED